MATFAVTNESDFSRIDFTASLQVSKSSFGVAGKILGRLR